MAAGRILFLGSTNNLKKGTLYFKDDSGAMLAYTGNSKDQDNREASIYDKAADNNTKEFRDSLALDLGHWSDLGVMTSGMPGTPRYVL